MGRSSAAEVSSYYDVLDLPSPETGAQPSQQEIKAAYHRALLRHHPDKAMTRDPPAGLQVRAPSRHTVEQIITAYKILISPSARTEHDGAFCLNPRSTLHGVQPVNKAELSSLGPEVIDLDEMSFNQDKVEWHRSCRCGDEKGFLITEKELEEDAGLGILVVGCRGCSLCLTVMFQAVMEDDDQAVTDQLKP